MPQREQPQLEPGQIIPAFTLPGADGMPHSPWDYKQREHLVLLFIHNPTTGEGSDLLRTFSTHYRDFREESCAIMAITAEPVVVNLELQEALRLPYPLLSDPHGKVIASYTTWDGATKRLAPCIVLADRYGALYQQWLAETEAELPPISALLESLQYLNTLCTP
ncbi:MAG TPA: redoxin domain-containing protein [Ktedonobacteraceae bacterium]|nr:redoxin domain-containing protein [Ktedonobacteraceae bacterium]